MKIIIKIFICFSLIYTPFFAFAGAAEQWTIEEVVYDNIGKNLTYTASKTGAAANDYIYKAKVPVTAAATGSTVASMIRMGLAGAAIYGIVEGVGWIIENGVVKKKVKEEYDSDAYFFVPYLTDHFPTPEQAVKDFLSSQCSIDHPQYCSTSSVVCPVASGGSGTIYCNFYLPNGQSGRVNVDFRNVSKPPTSTYEPVPDSDLGAAVNNNPNAPNLLPDIYNPNNPAGGAAPQKTADALDSATPQPRTSPKTDIKKKPNSDTDGDGEPDVYDPSKPDLGSEFELPEFCSWAVTVCEWYKKYKDDSDLAKEHRLKQTEVWSKEELARQEEKQHRVDEKTFWEKVENWFDWSKDDTDLPDDEKPEIQDLPVPELKEDAIRWSAQCPADAQVPINMQGVSSTITFSWSPWCQLLDMIKPAIIASAYIGAAFIVLGLRT